MKRQGYCNPSDDLDRRGSGEAMTSGWIRGWILDMF